SIARRPEADAAIHGERPLAPPHGSPRALRALAMTRIRKAAFRTTRWLAGFCRLPTAEHTRRFLSHVNDEGLGKYLPDVVHGVLHLRLDLVIVEGQAALRRPVMISLSTGAQVHHRCLGGAELGQDDFQMPGLDVDGLPVEQPLRRQRTAVNLTQDCKAS